MKLSKEYLSKKAAKQQSNYRSIESRKMSIPSYADDPRSMMEWGTKSTGNTAMFDKLETVSNNFGPIPHRHRLRPHPVLRSVNERSLDLNALNVKKKLLEGMLSQH